MNSSMDLADSMIQGMRHLASGVAIVATRDEKGKRFAMTVSSITSLTANPPSLLVCLNENSHTHSALQEVGQFSVNILSHAQQQVSVNCSMIADGEERFAAGNWKQQDDSKLPYLDDALSVFFCSVNQKINYGTHTIVIGNIQSVIVDNQDQAPLVYCRGEYHKLP